LYRDTWVITALHWCTKELEGFLWEGGAVVGLHRLNVVDP
jgi:hypothetical protein